MILWNIDRAARPARPARPVARQRQRRLHRRSGLSALNKTETGGMTHADDYSVDRLRRRSPQPARRSRRTPTTRPTTTMPRADATCGRRERGRTGRGQRPRRRTVAEPVATDTVTTPTPAPEKKRGFPWGVLGLLGLVGLIPRARALARAVCLRTRRCPKRPPRPERTMSDKRQAAAHPAGRRRPPQGMARAGWSIRRSSAPRPSCSTASPS